MKLKPATIIKRDELVYEIAKKYNTPIVMLTRYNFWKKLFQFTNKYVIFSGGWQTSKQKTVADSVLNLIDKKLINQIDSEKNNTINEIGSKV